MSYSASDSWVKIGSIFQVWSFLFHWYATIFFFTNNIDEDRMTPVICSGSLSSWSWYLIFQLHKNCLIFAFHYSFASWGISFFFFFFFCGFWNWPGFRKAGDIFLNTKICKLFSPPNEAKVKPKCVVTTVPVRMTSDFVLLCVIIIVFGPFNCSTFWGRYYTYHYSIGFIVYYYYYLKKKKD